MEEPKLTESHSLTVQGQAFTITDLNYCNRCLKSPVVLNQGRSISTSGATSARTKHLNKWSNLTAPRTKHHFQFQQQT